MHRLAKKKNLAQQHYINISYTNFSPNQTTAVENAGKLHSLKDITAFTVPIFKKLITILLIMWRSSIPNVTLIDQYILKITHLLRL